MRTTAFITRHSVPSHFALTFAISWIDTLLAIASADREMQGTTPTSDARFA